MLQLEEYGHMCKSKDVMANFIKGGKGHATVLLVAVQGHALAKNGDFWVGSRQKRKHFTESVFLGCNLLQ